MAEIIMIHTLQSRAGNPYRVWVCSVPTVLLHRWMIPGNRGTVTVEKQQICKIEAALNYIIDKLTPTNIILTKKNWLSYKWCRRLVEKVTARNKYTVSLLLQMFQA